MGDRMLPERLRQALDLVVTDLTEANAAVQIIYAFIRRHDDLANTPKDIQQVWHYIEQSVCWKMSLAVERLLQHPKNDRASILGLFREINTASKSGFKISDPSRLDAAKREFKSIRNDPLAKQLKSARDAFMGHTLIGKTRNGLPVMDVVDLVTNLHSVVVHCHFAVTGKKCIVDEHYDLWTVLAADWENQAIR